MYVNSAAAPAMLPRVRNLQRSTRPRLALVRNFNPGTGTRCNAPPPIVGRRAGWQPTLVRGNGGLRRGVGALDQQQASIASIAASGASLASGTLVAMGAIAGPVGVAIGGLITLGLQLANVFSGCGQTCVEATSIANQVGALLTQMFNTYMAAPVHYQSMQTAYLQQWDAAWQALEQACSNPQLGAAGQRCITDRQRGSCKWHTSPGGWQQTNGTWNYVAPGADGSGSTCWDWFVGTRDPVANDPTVVPDPSPASAAASSAGNIVSSAVSSITGGGINPLWLGAAALGALWLFMGDN